MARRRPVRWLLYLSLTAIAVVAAAVVSVPLWIRPLIAWQASATLARPVTIGYLGLHFGDPVIVSAEDVVVGNPSGFARDEEPFARIPRLTVQIEVVASIWRRAVVIASVELVRPAIRAIATEDGRENYRLASVSRPRIGALSVLDGRARVSLAALRADFETTFATEREAEKTDTTRIVAEARGIYAGESVAARFAGNVPLNAQDPVQPWRAEISVRNGPTQISVKGTLQDPFSPGGVTGEFLISGPDMARLKPLTGVPFPVTPPYELRGRLGYAAGIYRAADVKGRLGWSSLEGTMTVATRHGQRPEITADILSPSLDLRDIVSLLSGKSGPSGTPGQTQEQRTQAAPTERKAVASPRVLPQAPFHAAKFDLANVHLTFHAQRVQGASMPFDNLAFDLDVVDGGVALHQLSAAVGQGRITGDIWLTPRADETLLARADIHFERLDVSHLLRASGRFKGNGALNGAVRLDGTGGSIAEILASADGAASLWMLGGDLSSLLVDLAGLRLGSALLSSLNGSPTTTVECFVADLVLRRGVLSTRTLTLETADAITEGSGAVDVGQERVEVRLRTQSKRLTIGVLPAPLLISGTLKDPRVAPDPATPAGRGGLAGALAALPTVQRGLGDAPHCQSLLNQVRKG
jgi:AsmA family protein